MSAIWGNNLKVAIFGESHGPAIGVTLTGLPAGIPLDLTEIQCEMQRRAPGKGPLVTARQEKDIPEIVSGFYQGMTTGTPLCVMIANQNQRSEDYETELDLPRPGHGDYPGYVRYGGKADPRGGGHFSGRLTAPLVFAGAVCKQILGQYGVQICAHIQAIQEVHDLSFAEVIGPKNDLKDILTEEIIAELSKATLPLLDPTRKTAMEQSIMKAKTAGDSVGGIIECAILGLAAGIGEPFFDSVESSLAHLLFSVPGVKGVEFGDGFALAARLGSQCNDAYYYQNSTIRTHTNHCGGILGGITTGMPVIFRTALRPTASIAQPQKTVSLKQNREAAITVQGRHDPCIVPRAVPVIEAVTAIVILDLLKEQQACKI
jgi:chorismate synthase